MKPLTFVLIDGYYKYSAGNESLNQIDMMQQALHLWHNGQTVTEQLEPVDHRRPGYKPFSFPGWNHTIDNKIRLTEGEKFYGIQLNENNRPMILHSEKKSEALIKTTVKTYNQLVEFLSDPFGGSY